MTRAKAFCPGHITGFFEIHRTSDVLSTGSRGAGLCLTLGATSSVELLESHRVKIRVSIDGKEHRAEVTKSAVKHLLGTDKVEVNVATTLDLPVSQGFGMSAAGSLSASIALAELLGRDRHRAFEAAHTAEIECGSGLGDVSALHKGGITIRKTAGLPPVGEVLRIEGEPEVVLCVAGRKMLTGSILRDPKKSKSINVSGGRCVDKILQNRTLETLMSLSHSFSVDTGLSSNKISKMVEECNSVGMASMAMLGNSVFSIGNTQKLRDILTRYGPVWECRVDCIGPRML